MTKEFTQYESDIIRERLAKYAVIVPDKVRYFWTDFWMESTLGQFKPKDKIYLSKKDRLAIIDDGVADSIILHELEHYRQYKAGKIKYYLGNLFKVNEWAGYARQEGADAEWEMQNKLDRIKKSNLNKGV